MNDTVKETKGKERITRCRNMTKENPLHNAISVAQPNILDCFGFCRHCQKEHRLPAALALPSALQLMADLEAQGRIDFALKTKDSKNTKFTEEADSRFATKYLWGAARGKMFGVLIATAPNGTTVCLRAFSGQYNGVWQIPGWAKPVFDLEAFHRVQDAEEKKIKDLGKQINAFAIDSEQRRELIRLRKRKSQILMRALHRLYRLRNFSGQIAGLEEIFPPRKGIPTGTGDCCAPKLLQHAAKYGLVPLGLAEFYWGRANASGSRQHGVFYLSCQAKCQPILGFMLCGLERGGIDGMTIC